jgi:hypothetical protein
LDTVEGDTPTARATVVSVTLSREGGTGVSFYQVERCTIAPRLEVGVILARDATSRG